VVRWVCASRERSARNGVAVSTRSGGNSSGDGKVRYVTVDLREAYELGKRMVDEAPTRNVALFSAAVTMIAYVLAKTSYTSRAAALGNIERIWDWCDELLGETLDSTATTTDEAVEESEKTHVN
jgi:hypothetical protein